MDSFPPNVIELIQRQLSQFGRVGATKIYRAPALSGPMAALAGTEVSPGPMRIKEPGTMIAMYGQELAGTAAQFAATEVRVQIGGNEDLFTDGQSGAFVPMLALFGGAQNWFPIWRRAKPGTDWFITYRSADAVAKTPSVYFAFIADGDIGRNAPPAR